MPIPTTHSDFQKLRDRHKELERQKTTAEANLALTNQQLETMKTELREKYGTDDLDRLRAQLEELQRGNDRKRDEYQAHLAQIEARLAEVQTPQDDGA